MKKSEIAGLFLILVLAFSSLLSACGLLAKDSEATSAQNAKSGKNLEIDYTKIAGDTPESRLNSFLSLMNSKTKGYARLFGWIEQISVGKPENVITVYSYVLMVYGEPDLTKAKEKGGQKEISLRAEEYYRDNVESILGQVAAYSAKFVVNHQGNNGIMVQVSYPYGAQKIWMASSQNVVAMRTAPTEIWRQYLNNIPMVLMPAEELMKMTALISELMSELASSGAPNPGQ